MGITLFSQIDRYTLEDAKVELSCHFRLPDGAFEEIPMGIFEVSEANRHLKTLELKAYDYMLRFEKSFNGFETVGNAYAFLELCCRACNVELAHTKEEIEAMPNTPSGEPPELTPQRRNSSRLLTSFPHRIALLGKRQRPFNGILRMQNRRIVFQHAAANIAIRFFYRHFAIFAAAC